MPLDVDVRTPLFTQPSVCWSGDVSLRGGGSIVESIDVRPGLACKGIPKVWCRLGFGWIDYFVSDRTFVNGWTRFGKQKPVSQVVQGGWSKPATQQSHQKSTKQRKAEQTKAREIMYCAISMSFIGNS
jgi:hypothetical protein